MSTGLDFNPHFGAFVLETLTLGMYGESRNAIREYVQNAFDSLRQSIPTLNDERTARIDVLLNTEDQILTIKDNGGGLSQDNAVLVLASVGASNKNYRRNAGFRGIGRLAGVVFCNTLTFSTKAKGESVYTKVEFDAAALRGKLSPEGRTGESAAETLKSCVKATLEPAEDIEAHYFKVELKGFVNPPKECLDIEHLRNFLKQVSPLPYRPDFPHSSEIVEYGLKLGRPVDCVRMFVGENVPDQEELFKPYGMNYGIKKVRVALTHIDLLESPTQRWWGWVGRVKTPGSIKDDEAKGIRVRVRNIQIDGTDLMKEIFANSRLDDKPRNSYSRFVDWYVGEIFVNPNAAVPNARRDGFEEDQDWALIRDELDSGVATIYGKLAYKTSTANQLSLVNLTKKFDSLSDAAAPIANGLVVADWDQLSQITAEANALQTKLRQAVKDADEEEVSKLRSLSNSVSALKSSIDTIAVVAPSNACQDQVVAALADQARKLQLEFRRRLSPTEWQKVSQIVFSITGVDADD